MPWFLPVITATATFALARKIVARYWHGTHAKHAQHDPEGLRTVARFHADAPQDVLRAISRELSRDLAGVEVTKDAIRADADGTLVDIVRMAHREGATTVELTRAWTGVYLGEQTRALLKRMHDALVASAREVTWFARQDRELVDAHAVPFDENSRLSYG